MSRLIKFVVLILVGFGLGAGLAWFQQSQQAPAPAAAVEQQMAATESEAPAAGTVVPGAPEMPVADAAMEGASPQPQDAMTAMTPDSQPSPSAVAGSSVGGAFALTDHNGQAVTDQSWPGKMKLVFFGFTHCPDICPAALDKMTTALNVLGPAAVDIQPLFITVDAANDTPEAMKAYLAAYHPSIVGLTGTQEQLKAAEDAYKVYASPQESGMMDHSAYIYLMSPDNKLLEILGSAETADGMAAKIKPHTEKTVAQPAPAAMPAETPAAATP